MLAIAVNEVETLLDIVRDILPNLADVSIPRYKRNAIIAWSDENRIYKYFLFGNRLDRRVSATMMTWTFVYLSTRAGLVASLEKVALRSRSYER